MKFVMVGVVNTIVGTTIMFVFYNVFHLSYWVSSASNYFFGSIVSYFLNKHFTFQYHERGWGSLIRFTINILICYLLAYGIAKPIIKFLLSTLDTSIQENISMALGMCLFVVFNYIGQRVFAFNKHYSNNKMKVILVLVYMIASQTGSFAQNNSSVKLPVIYLTGEFDYEYKEGSVTLMMPDGSSKENLKGVIKWRGGTTNTEEKHKRNYKIKLEDDQQFFGLRNDNKWILDAGQADLFRLRNRIATELWNDMAEKPYYSNQEADVRTGVRGQVVELYLNNEYRGIYCLTECMDRKQLKLKKFDKNTGEIKGGLWKSESYGVSLMWHTIPYDNKSETWDAFEVKYPELDDVEETDYSTLYNAIDFVVSSSDEEFRQHVHEYFDIPVVIDYYIFLYTLNAFDNVGKNMFWAVYDKTKDKKLTPAVWDLDATVGAKWLGDWSSPEFDIDINLNLIVRLKELNVDDFNDKVNERYHVLRGNQLSTENLIERYSNYYELIKNSGAAQREEEKWSRDTDVNGEEINFEKEIEYIKDWITRHMTYLDTNIFQLDTKITTISFNNSNTHHIFNLNGQKVKTMEKGVYINNGKKYVVK